MAPSGRRGLTSWEHSELLIAPGEVSGFTLKKYSFLDRSFSVFFIELLAEMIPKCPQICDLGSPGRRFVATFLSLSPTLCLIKTIMFYYVFATFTNVR